MTIQSRCYFHLQVRTVRLQRWKDVQIHTLVPEIVKARYSQSCFPLVLWPPQLPRVAELLWWLWESSAKSIIPSSILRTWSCIQTTNSWYRKGMEGESMPSAVHLGLLFSVHLLSSSWLSTSGKIRKLLTNFSQQSGLHKVIALYIIKHLSEENNLVVPQGLRCGSVEEHLPGNMKSILAPQANEMLNIALPHRTATLTWGTVLVHML